MDKKKPFKVAKWIMLSLAVLFNSFIIFYSCLDDKTTNEWSRFVSNIFTNVVNGFTPKEVETIPVSDVNVSFSAEEEYNLRGYASNAVPLGYQKGIKAEVLPKNATNKAVTYSTTDNDIIRLDQSESYLVVTGLQVGTAEIKVTTSDPNIYKTIEVEVTNLVAPAYYEASIKSNTIPIGSYETVNIGVKRSATGGVIEDAPFYDIYKLSFDSDNHSIATIGQYGVITPVSEGSTTIRVSNNTGISYSFDVTVTSGTPAHEYENLWMVGDDWCYSNRSINLGVKDGTELLDPEEFIWESSNIVLASVNTKGEVFGRTKLTLENETVTIKATNKKTHQVVTKDVVVRTEPPTRIYTCYQIGSNDLWNQPKVTSFVGDVVKVIVSYDRSVIDRSVTVVLSDESIASYIVEGSNVVLQLKKEGSTDVTIRSVLNPELSSKTRVTVVKAGAIGQDDIEDVHLSIRKSIGHALMFGVTQVFTFLTLYMFLYDKKKWWMIVIISFAAGVLLASVSELIQFFIPLRSGTFIDVLIDTSGVAIGLGITLGITYLVERFKKKKKKSRVAKD